MTLAVELEPEHREEYERLAAEKRANPTPSPPRRDDRRIDAGVSVKTLYALRKNPMAADENGPKPGRPRVDPAEKLRAFAVAVSARFSPGDRVSASAAASAAGVAESVAVDCIGRLRARGEWPYERGARGPGGLRRAAAEPARTTVTPKPRAAIPSVERLDLSGVTGVKPAPAAAKPVEAPTPEPAPAAPALPDVARGGLATLAARLREAADLIDRAAAIVADAMGGAA